MARVVDIQAAPEIGDVIELFPTRRRPTLDPDARASAIGVWNSWPVPKMN
jgi:hypothetical protein